MAKGKMIVLAGINNIGKSTQAKLLVEKLKEQGIEAEYLKYPIYDLEPTGPRLNRILREGAEKGISGQDLQTIFAQNRRDFEPTLKQKLESGIWMVAEDYTGTGIAWGVANGASLEFLEEINKDLFKEDLTILMDGERFLEAREQGHLHESNDELTNRCRKVHLELAKKYSWQIVNANQPIETVSKIIESIVERKFFN